MSETVHYRGTLTEVKKLENETLEEQCKRLLDNKNLPSYYDTYKEMLLDEFYKEYVINDNVIYSVDKQSVDMDENIFRVTKRDDGIIDFEVRYYNGGCGFEEAIENAFKNYIKTNRRD